MSMPANDNKPKTFDATVYIALFWKFVPMIGGIFVALGFIPKDWVDYVMNNQATLSQAAAGVIAGVVAVYTVWKNRPWKRIADVAAIPGVDVSATPELAAKATTAASNDAKSSIVAKAA
jgi:hypothetical protein